jgi:hypothetical protein
MNRVILCLFVLVSFTAMAQPDLAEAGKKKAQQQDFNTTRNNKDRNSLKSSAPEAMPPAAPAPSAPMPGAKPDSAAVHLDWYQFEFHHVFDYRLINAAPAPRNDVEVRMIYGRTACWVEEFGKSTITIQDFLRNKIFYVDTTAKTVKIAPLNPVNSTQYTASFSTNNATKLIQEIPCKQYSNQASNNDEYATFLLAEDLELDVIYQQYRPYVLEMDLFNLFVNGKKPVLEQINYSMGQPTNAMSVFNVEKKKVKLDLTNYTLLP